MPDLKVVKDGDEVVPAYAVNKSAIVISEIEKLQSEVKRLSHCAILVERYELAIKDSEQLIRDQLKEQGHSENYIRTACSEFINRIELFLEGKDPNVCT